MRLDKFLSESGVGTRKEVKHLISSGAVTINDQLCKKSAQHIDPQKDNVYVHGDKIEAVGMRYYMLNKPKGVISATEDNQHQTVIDVLGNLYAHMSLFPVGRLDKDTTGLLLLTNDGQLAHQLLSPKKKVDKTYYATIQGIVTQDDIEMFQTGLDLGDFVTLPARLVILDIDCAKNQSTIEVTIKEGKFHQVKRMFKAVNKEVIMLHRLTMGPLKLPPELKIGEFRELTVHEQALLRPFGLKNK